MKDSFVGSSVFGTWKVVDRIGAGSFGTVYEIARNDYYGVNYTAALKVISIPKDENEEKTFLAEGYDLESLEEIVKDITSEISLMAKLKGHSNIISFEDHMVIKHENSIGWDILIRMEYLTPLLDYLISQDELTAKSILKIGIDICSALELCQKYNIVHRDIKPENIFVSNNNDFKLGDFGIARTIERASGSFSKKGSYNYMAPEVYKGEHYGATIDIYSLGLVLYRFFNSNKTPFLNTETSRYTVDDRERALNRRMRGEPLEKPKYATDEIADVILKACEYKAENRYSNPSEFKRELLKLYTEVDDYVVTCFSKDVRQNSLNLLPKKESEQEAPNYSPTRLMWDSEPKKKEEEKVEVVPEKIVEEEAVKPEKAKNKKLLLVIAGVVLAVAIAVAVFLGISYQNGKTTTVAETTTEETTTKPTTTEPTTTEPTTEETTTETTTKATTTSTTKSANNKYTPSKNTNNSPPKTPPTTRGTTTTKKAYIPPTSPPTRPPTSPPTQQSNWNEYTPDGNDSNYAEGSWEEY